MVDYNLINSLELEEDLLEQELGTDTSNDAIASFVDETIGNFQAGTILKGKIVGMAGDDVVVDVGLKSEGLISQNEWDDKSAIDVGDEIDVRN